MDLEMENRLAALLVEEARRLRREADKDGVLVYLQKPNVRGRPNSRFLTATILGVEQANRATEISEMWRAREKERQLDVKRRHESKANNSRDMHVRNGYLNDSKPWPGENTTLATSSNKRHKITSPRCSFQSRRQNDLRESSNHCSSSKRYSEDSPSIDDDALQDDDMEEFLHSRAKRGRGSVGCRMDEPGPYLPSTSADLEELIPAKEQKRRILGPEKPHFLKSNPSHEDICYSMLQASDECKSKKDLYKEEKKSKREKSENQRKERSSKHQKKHRRRDTGKQKTKYV